MTERVLRQKPKPPQRLPPPTRGADRRLRGKRATSPEAASAVPSDLRSEIIANWNLDSDNINTCVSPEQWPLNEPDPETWHTDIVRLLHEASTLSRGDHKTFQIQLKAEITSRQSKNRSAKGKVEYMTVTDLKKVCKRLEGIEHEQKELEHEKEGLKQEKKGSKHEKKGPEHEKKEVEGQEDPKEVLSRPTRRGRSNGKPTEPSQPSASQATKQNPEPETKQPAAQRGKGRPKPKPQTKQQPSHLALRPARHLRSTKSPKTAPSAPPPPVTPANPPEHSSEDEDADNGAQNHDPAPPSPVSGRHIYGTYIKPTTVDFYGGDPSSPPAAAAAVAAGGRRRTRKRGRANADADADAERARQDPPTETTTLDSDPRDFDATGFLSELDPREARRRRGGPKPRLSLLADEPVAEPAWSQDVVVEGDLEPELELGLEPGLEFVPPAPLAPQAPTSAAAVEALETLIQALPAVPGCATPEERRMLADRVVLLRRDVVAYEMSVWEIGQRGNV